MRRFRNHVAGFALLFIGISIVVSLIDFGHFLLGPLFLFGVGLILYHHVHRWIGYFLFGLAAIALIHGVLGIDVFGFLFAAFFFYVGYCLLTDKPLPLLDRLREQLNSWSKGFSRKDHSFEKSSASFRGEGMSRQDGFNRSSLIGNVRMEGPFELEDVLLSHAVCDTTIDLSKAVIPDGESTLVISSLIGDVDIYVPYDMPVSVGATAIMGDLKILDHRHSGFGCRIHTETPGYRQSSRRVKITVSLLIGDVDVRVL